jgi:hypothetical protein
VQMRDKKNQVRNKNAILEMKNQGDYLTDLRKKKKSLTVPQSRELSVAQLK